jgi:hypothetical protein
MSGSSQTGGRTEEGAPVDSFKTLLKDLATIVKSRVRVTSGTGTEFYLVTRPTETQRQALNLLGVPPGP